MLLFTFADFYSVFARLLNPSLGALVLVIIEDN